MIFKAYCIFILWLFFIIVTNSDINKFDIPKFIIDSNTLIISQNAKIDKSFNKQEYLSHLRNKLNIYEYKLKSLDITSNITLQNQLNQESNLNHEKIKELLYQNCKISIKKQIQNKKQLQKTKNLLKSDKSKLSFAQNKGKSSSLTETDLKLLQNSSYIYIPYITEFTVKAVKKMEKPYKTNLQGGLLWYQIISHENNEISFKLLKDISVNCHDASKWFEINIYEEFSQTVQNVSKEMAEFKPKINITSAIKNTYILNKTSFIKMKIGDELMLKRYDLTNKGIKVSNKGIIQITSLSPDTLAMQRTGELQSQGAWAEAYPRLGLDINVGYGQFLKINDHAVHVFSSNITAPLVRLTNKQNLYLFFNTDFSLMNIPINESKDFDISLKRINQWILGLEKRYWMKKTSIGLKVGFGMQERSYGQRLAIQNWDFAWLETNKAFLSQIGLTIQRPIGYDWFLRTELNKTFTTRSFYTLLNSAEKRNINFNHNQIMISLYYKIPSKGINNKGESAQRTVSSILDIGNYIYKSIDFVMKMMNTGISYKEDVNKNDE